MLLTGAVSVSRCIRPSGCLTRCFKYSPMLNKIEVDRMDHLVLTVANIDKTIAFYSNVLGMTPVTFGAGRKALVFGRNKFNLHEKGKEFEPKALFPTPGGIDICLIVNCSLDVVQEQLAMHNIPVCEGPVMRTGAIGKIESVYIRDPDENLVELSVYREEE